MNKNNPFFSVGQTVFLYKTKKNKKGWRPTAQKHACRVALPPIPRRMRTKRETPKQKEGGVKRTTSYLRKRGRSKNPEKDAKTLRTAAARPILARPTSDTRRDTPARPECLKFVHAWESMWKTPFSKRARFCSPKAFFTLETEFGQVFELQKIQNCNTRKIILTKGLQKGVEEIERREIAPKSLLSFYLFDFVAKRQDATNDQKCPERGFKKMHKKPPKWPLCEKTIPPFR